MKRGAPLSMAIGRHLVTPFMKIHSGLFLALLLCLAGCQTEAPSLPAGPVMNEVHFTGSYFSQGQVDQIPKVFYQAQPSFPSALRRAGIRGSATIGFLVDQNGHPQQLQIKQASDAAFGDAAIDSIKHWHFHPALKDGKPVVYEMYQTLDFDLGPT